MSIKLGTTVSEVAQSGPGLVFIAYPKALRFDFYSFPVISYIISLSLMPGAKFWAFLFFSMLAMVGLGKHDLPGITKTYLKH